MSSSKFATTFAPYSPPPDESRTHRPWFPVHASSEDTTSYQSGAIPSFGTAVEQVVDGPVQINEWESTLSLRIDFLAAMAYALGPISALALLIAELQNDYVRFHAYQSALLTTPLVLLRILTSLLQFTPWLRTFCTCLLIFSIAYMAFRAYRDAPVRYELPLIGSTASHWLSLE